MVIAAMLVLAHRGANRRAPENTVPAHCARRVESAPTASSSTSTAPPTARWWSATTPRRPVGPAGPSSPGPSSPGRSPEVPILAGCSTSAGAGWSTSRSRTPDPRAVDAVRRARGRSLDGPAAGARRRAGVVVPPRRPSTGCTTLAPDVPDRRSCRSGSTRSTALDDRRSSTATPRCTPTCGRSLRSTSPAVVAAGARPSACR